ncbi:MAG: N-formylglutamate amidohydrolase [Pseudomonadota bacterium]
MRAPLLLNSPHSGRAYPSGFIAASKLDALTLRRSEDAYVDELLKPATQRGVPMMHVLFPRAFLDVNREPYELDPRMFSGRLPPFANTRSVRVAGGLGTIARIVADAKEIYAAPLCVNKALNRIETYHKPYHRALKSLLHKVRHRFGHVVMIDCHSMPSVMRGTSEKTKADFVLGDRYGTSCAPGILDVAHKTLESFGYRVARNKPYAGGYITEHYGAPAQGYHVLQLEVNRALYLDEQACEKTDGFDVLARRLGQLVEALLVHLDTALDEKPMAAE